MKLLFLGLLFNLLVSCQVKEAASDGSLVSGHSPTSNSFKLQTPAAKTYVDGEVISLVITFPFAVTVTGTPRLALTVGASTVYADYVSGDQSTSLTFQYTVAVGDNDSDGITVASLGLNGGTMTFLSNNVVTNCNVASLTSKTFSTVKVDNTVPAPTAFTQTNLPGFYHKNDALTFSVTFSEAVVVTGSPRILMDFQTGAAVYATYTGGSGSTTLAFSFIIDNTIAETNNYDSIAGSIDLNGGTISDSVGNAATLSIAAYTAAALTAGATRPFDGRVPYVVSVTPPANATYSASQALDFDIEFDRAVNVTGSPYIGVTIGSNVRQAAYYSGTGTNVLKFRYTTIPGDVDTDGVVVATTVTQNSGAITGAAAPANSYFSPVANNVLTIPSTTGILVNSVQPQPISATRNVDSTNRTWGGGTDNTWNIGQDLLITVNFNTNMYVDQTSGTPRIPITIGATTRYATYLSGGNGQAALVFRYVIQEGDLDTDGSIALGSIDLNNGNITDVANTNTLLTIPTTALLTTLVDGVRPTISNVNAPANGTYSTVVNTMDFTVTWSEAVNYSSAALNLPLTIGASAVNAPYISGSNTATIIHRPTILALMTDVDGVAMSSPMTGTAVIKDQAGNTANVLTYSPPVTTGILVDTTIPGISSVTPPSAGTYLSGDDLNFTVNFNEVVNVNSTGGYPRIAIAMGSGTKYATYVSGSGTSNILFRYTIVSGDSDLSGNITAPSQVSSSGGAYIRDLGQNVATNYAMTTTLAGVVIDALAPSISSRTIPGNGTYDSGDVLQFTTTFSEVVNVTGTPRIQVAAQTGTLNFDYVSGSGTNTLTFSYTVTANDFDFDGLPNSVNTVSLNGGSIRDAQTNNASLTFTTANLSQVYLAFPNTVIWSSGSTFSNASAIAGLTVSSGGAATTGNCALSGPCRFFTGDDTFNISGALNGVEEVFIVFQTASVLGNMNLFGTDISLVDDGSNFDLNTSNGTLNLDGATYSGVNHNTNVPVSTTKIMHMIFNTAQNYGAGALIPSSFQGAIGDVIVVTSPLTAAQRSAILTYLNSKY